MPAPVELPSITVPTVEESPTVSLELGCHALGIRLSKGYELAKTGELTKDVPVLRVGWKYRVPTASLRRALSLDVEPTTVVLPGDVA